MRYLGLPAIGGLPKETLAHSYDDWGNVERITGTSADWALPEVYLDSASYSPFGEVSQRWLGVKDKPQAQHTYTYEEDTRRVSEFFFDRDGTTVPSVAHVKWSYDHAGNVLSVADTPEDQPAKADVQCFGHDYLRRMTEAWSQGSGACAAAPSREVLGGQEPYWHSYSYRADGSRTKMVDHTLAGEDVTTDYTYPAAGQPQPRTLQQVSTGGQADTYAWDETGNLKSRTRGGKTESFTWDAGGKPTAITTESGTAKMYYAAGGNRIARVDADGTASVYVHGHELSRPAGGTATATRYYSHGGSVIATRATGGELTWLGADHHGTTDWAINSVTMNSSVKRRDPFGNQRGHDTPSAWPVMQHGFVGGTQDPTGLVQLGARPYDPTLGILLTVDPLTDPFDPQRMHPYAYGNNTPPTFADPSGLAYECGPGCANIPAPQTSAGQKAATNAAKHGTKKPPQAKPSSGQTRPAWSGDLARNKARLLEEYGYTSWNTMVAVDLGPQPGVQPPLSDPLREEVLGQLHERTCAEHPDDCASIAEQIAAGSVIMAAMGIGGEASPREKYIAAKEVQRAVDHVQQNNSVRDTLQKGLTAKQLRFLRKVKHARWATRMLYGTALQNLVHRQLESVHGRGSWESRGRGVDFKKVGNGAVVELTTRGQVNAHRARGGEYRISPTVAYNITAALSGFK